jgi:cytochrome c-type biogenesis protein CcmH
MRERSIFFPVVADLYSARGEALVAAANDTVTADAKQALGEALKLNAKEPRARYFLALAKAQTGDKAAALDDWIELANDVGANDPTIPALGQHLAELAKELNVDISKKLHRPLITALGRTAVEPKSPTIGSVPNAKMQSNPKQADVSAIVPPANQAVAIGDMVERLSRRLERSPRDVDGWIMLIRSKKELNDSVAARQAFERALKIFDEGSVERDRLMAAAKSFGLSP